MTVQELISLIPAIATLIVGVVLATLVARMGTRDPARRLFAVVSGLIALGAAGTLARPVVFPAGVSGFAATSMLFLQLAALPLAGRIVAYCRGQGHKASVHALRAGGGALLTSLAASIAFPGVRTVAVWVAVAAAVVSFIAGFTAGSGVRGAHRKAGTSRGLHLVDAGALLLAALVATDCAAAAAHGPAAFGFVPLLVMARGVLGAEGGPAKGLDRKLFAVASLSSFCLMPAATLVVYVLSFPDTSSWWEVPWDRWLFVLGSSVSFAVCLVVFLTILRDALHDEEEQGTGMLVCLFAAMAAIMNLRDVLGVFHPREIRDIVSMGDIFLAAMPGVALHLARRTAKERAGLGVVVFYAAGLVYALVMVCASAVPHPVSPMARWAGHFMFVSAVLLAFARSLQVLGRFAASPADPTVIHRIRFMILGYSIGLAIVFASALFSAFRPGVTLFFLAWVPVVLVALGSGSFTRVFLDEPTKRRTVSLALRAALASVYSAALVWAFVLLRPLSGEYVLGRLVPFGIPPLLSFMSAAFLSLMILALERNRPESVPFGLVCFCYALLNLDILLVGIIPDPEVSLMVSRADHFFLVLVMLGANLHLGYLITGRRTGWSLVRGAYVFGAFMAPLTLTDWYFTGMYSYYWGFFAKKAVLYDVMSTVWLAGVVFAIRILFTAFRKVEERRKRTLKKVLIAFISLAALSLTNTPAIYGYEIYPLGTFVFLPLLYLTYSIFTYNLSMALQHLRRVLSWGGFSVLLVATACLPAAGFGWSRGAFITGIVLAGVLHMPIRGAWDAFLNLFIPLDTDILRERYRSFTSDLSHVHRLDELHRLCASWLFSALGTTRVTSLFPRTDESGFAGWTSFNGMPGAGLFEDRAVSGANETGVHADAADPLIRVCGKTRKVMAREEMSHVPGCGRVQGSASPAVEDAEMTVPVYSHDRLVAVILLGRKLDGSRYSRPEADLLSDMAVFLGPHVENARLLENLENEVEARTQSLNDALKEALVKERQIVERNALIERQNHISQVLLRTSTEMHRIRGLNELFSFTLEQMHALFPSLSGGIFLEGAGHRFVEAAAFINLTEAQRRFVMDWRDRGGDPHFAGVTASGTSREGMVVSEPDGASWNVFPLVQGQAGEVGWVILNMEEGDRMSWETVRLFVSHLSAVVQNRLLLSNLERMASTDGLTGVYNRAFLDRELDKAVKHARRFKDMWFSVMVVDVNGLKDVNDTYGHASGDEVIVKVATLLRETCRETDIVARIGGDEFAVLMPSTNLVQAGILLERIRDVLRGLSLVVSPSPGFHISLPIHVSIGLAGSDQDDPELVMKVADDLMYADKQRFYAEYHKKGDPNQDRAPTLDAAGPRALTTTL